MMSTSMDPTLPRCSAVRMGPHYSGEGEEFFPLRRTEPQGDEPGLCNQEGWPHCLARAVGTAAIRQFSPKPGGRAGLPSHRLSSGDGDEQLTICQTIKS